MFYKKPPPKNNKGKDSQGWGGGEPTTTWGKVFRYVIVPFVPSALLLSGAAYISYRRTGSLSAYSSGISRINDTLPNNYARAAFWGFIVLHPLEASFISGILFRRGWGLLKAVRWGVVGLGLGFTGLYHVCRRRLGYPDPAPSPGERPQGHTPKAPQDDSDAALISPPPRPPPEDMYGMDDAWAGV